MDTQPENIKPPQNPQYVQIPQNVNPTPQKSGSKKYVYILLIIIAIIATVIAATYIITNKSPIKLAKDYTGGSGIEGKSDIVSDIKEDTKAIVIKDSELNPPTLEVEVGEPVIWINEDKIDHTIKLPSGTPKTIKPGGMLLRTFKQKGTYEYKCTIHPDMTGTIEVS